MISRASSSVRGRGAVTPPHVPYLAPTSPNISWLRPERLQELYREIRTVYDRSLAPPGMHVMSSWSLYYPAHPKDGPWDAAKKQELIELHLEILSQFAPNFRECVQDLTLETPADIERRIGMTDGCIRHLDVTPQQYFSRRMPYRAPVRGLYLCGSGTHPGGELSGAPGHNCARAILRDLEGKAEDRV